MSSIIFWNFLNNDKLYLFTDIGSDTINSKYPSMLHQQNYQKTEDTAIKWSFNTGMGQNLFAGYLYHPNQLFNHFISQKTSLESSIIWKEIFKIVTSGILFFCFLKLFNISSLALIIGTLLYTFSGYMILGSSWFTHTTFVFNFTFLLFSFELFFRQKTFILFPLAIYFIGLKPQLYFFGVFLLIYSILRTVVDNQSSKKKLLIFYLKAATLGILGIFLSAPTIGTQISRFLDRSKAANLENSATIISFENFFYFENLQHYLTIIFRFLSNDILGNGSHFTGWGNYLEAPIFYIGLLSIILLPQSLFIATKKVKKVIIFLIFFWGMILIFPFFRHAFYLFLGDYYKTGLSLFIPISILFSAIYVLDQLLKNQSIKVHIPALFLTIISYLTLLYLPNFQDYVNKNLQLIITIYLLIYALILSSFNLPKYRNWSKIALLIIICIELTHFSWLTVNQREVVDRQKFEQRLGYNDFTKEAVIYLKNIDAGFYRINKTYSSGYAKHKSLNDAKAQNFYGTASYSSFNQKNYVRFWQKMNLIDPDDSKATKWLRGFNAYPTLQIFGGIKYNLKKTQEKKNDPTKVDIEQFGDLTLQRNRYYFPLGFTYNNYIEKADFDELTSEKQQLLLLKAFVSDTLTKASQIADFQAINTDDLIEINDSTWNNFYNYKRSTLNIFKHNQNEIKGSITTDKTSLLFLSIPFDKGWELLVDGEKQELELVNFGFMGTILEKGRHEIDLKFTPPFLKEGIIFAIIGLVCYFLLMLLQVYIWFKKSDFKSV